MIEVILGDNDFENARSLEKIIKSFLGDVEKIDGSELKIEQLPDLFMGTTLFATNRLIVIKNLSDNKPLWNELESWMERISNDIHLVLVESKPDKRTKTFKTLQKRAILHESKVWTDRDVQKAETWVIAEATQLGFTLDKKSAHTLVGRVGLDQWQIFSALEKLAVLDTVTAEIIEDMVEANPVENVFGIFDAVLKKDAQKAQDMLMTLKLTEDPYRLFGLLSTQVFQFAALAVSQKPAAEVARDMGVHPFVFSKMTSYASSYNHLQVRGMLTSFADADIAMKSLGADPWLCIEKAVISTCLV